MVMPWISLQCFNVHRKDGTLLTRVRILEIQPLGGQQLIEELRRARDSNPQVPFRTPVFKTGALAVLPALRAYFGRFCQLQPASSYLPVLDQLSDASKGDRGVSELGVLAAEHYGLCNPRYGTG